jgi:hypothetical protein
VVATSPNNRRFDTSSLIDQASSVYRAPGDSVARRRAVLVTPGYDPRNASKSCR